MVATPDGFTFLYDAGVGDFTVSRQDYTSLAGAYAASRVSLSSTRICSMDRWFLCLTSTPRAARLPVSPSPGRACTRVRSTRPVPDTRNASTLSDGAAVLPTSLVEAPLLPDPSGVMGHFIRGLAVLPFHNTFVSLSISGLTLLASNYDAPLPQPIITRVASAADGVSGVASGGLISVFGSNLSSSTIASSGTPLPTVVGNSCVLGERAADFAAAGFSVADQCTVG